jgi:dsRNA-specific ribonuclease
VSHIGSAYPALTVAEVNKNEYGEGNGATIRTAKDMAARNALIRLGVKVD